MQLRRTFFAGSLGAASRGPFHGRASTSFSELSRILAFTGRRFRLRSRGQIWRRSSTRQGFNSSRRQNATLPFSTVFSIGHR